MPTPCLHQCYVVVLDKERCRDGVMSDFVSWCSDALIPGVGVGAAFKNKIKSGF